MVDQQSICQKCKSATESIVQPQDESMKVTMAGAETCSGPRISKHHDIHGVV